ncbi:MAG: selenium cofactor biosynthesis protein YqeC, partial [Anaerolineales bacterium]|nr:selenium cofactor biosynthesis protein YqeC [Anaerolineales bacterium]
MRLSQTFRLSNSPCLALVGAGGKTTAFFQLARELPPPVIVTATTHLHVDQIKLADSHWNGGKPEDLAGLEKNLGGVMLVTGPVDGDRTTGLNDNSLSRLREVCASHNLPLLIEADGSRQRPLKAPADPEPAIPEFIETVVVFAGLTGLGKPLTEEFVHRPEIFARLSGLKMRETISLKALSRVLVHPAGGLKNIPLQARRIVLLNQADTPELQAQGKTLAEKLLPAYHSVI